MTRGLQPCTARGAEMVGAAERFAAEFADGALANDATGTFATEHLDKLRADRYLVAPIPEEFGGGGVDSVHDVLVASARLASGDPATAIGVNMHFAVLLNLVRAWRIALSRGAGGRASALARMLREIVADDIVFASAVSEPSPQNFTRPSTVARRDGDGWIIDGRKAFVTMAPAATILNTAVTYIAEGRRRACRVRPRAARVPRRRPPQRLGRPRDAVIGVRFGVVPRRAHSTAGRSATDSPPGSTRRPCSIGSSPPARSTPRPLWASPRRPTPRIISRLTERRDAVADDPHAMMCVADNVVELTAMQASLDLAARRIDDYFAAFPCGEATLDEAQSGDGRGPGGQGVHLRRRAARDRSGPDAQWRRRLHGGSSPRQSVARCPGRGVHAPLRRQSGLRSRRPHDAGPAGRTSPADYIICPMRTVDRGPANCRSRHSERRYRRVANDHEGTDDVGVGAAPCPRSVRAPGMGRGVRRVARRRGDGTTRRRRFGTTGDRRLSHRARRRGM